MASPGSPRHKAGTQQLGAGVAAATSAENRQLASSEKAPALLVQPHCANPTPIKAPSLLSDIAMKH